MAAVVIVLMAVLAVVAWKGNHTLGHLAHDKTSLMRATDAAAYSAAVSPAGPPPTIRHLQLEWRLLT